MSISRLDLAPVLIDDLPGDRQPQTVTVPVDARAPSIERHEQLLKVGIGHACAAVFNPDDGFIGPCGETDPDIGMSAARVKVVVA